MSNAPVTRLRFPAYRRYQAARVAASDSLMALLIGARLGEHALSTSPADESARLPELFGRIPGIARVNRTVGDAARLLNEAEGQLVAMGIPYVLSVHASFLCDAIEMLRADAKDSSGTSWSVAWRPDAKAIPLHEIHEYVVERCGRSLPPELLDLFHLARRIRNRIVHFGGAAGSRLPQEYRALSSQARAGWETLAGRPLTIDSRGQIELSDRELIAVLAITRHLAQAVNEMLVATLSREFWARLVISDYQGIAPQRFGEEAQQLRRLMGHARTFYGPVQLKKDELEQALGRGV